MRVASSCIDMLAGLLPIGMRKTPPGFCANPMPPIRHIANANAATVHVRPTRRIGPLRLCRMILPVEPDVFHRITGRPNVVADLLRPLQAVPAQNAGCHDFGHLLCGARLRSAPYAETE